MHLARSLLCHPAVKLHPLALGPSLLLWACVSAGSGAELEPAPGPAVGKPDSGDGADRECEIVLDRAGPRGTAPAGCDGSSVCRFDAHLDLAEEVVAAGAVPRVLYSTNGIGWFANSGAPSAEESDRLGYTRFYVPLFVIARQGHQDLRIELAPFYADLGGGRVFDYNRHDGDDHAYVLEAGNDWSIPPDPAACAP
jgi:hypothetical protein